CSMRLASKIFLTSSLVILVLAGVGALSLGAVGRLVSVNREITTQTVPALRVTGGLRDQMMSLARLDARYTVLRDARYAAAWNEGAVRVQADFARLRTLVRTSRERTLLGEAVAAGSYREPIPEARDELGALARSFNAMAAQLRRIDETKEEFYATLSHELRSPLTSVREAAHLLRDGVPGSLNAKQARLVTVIG